MVYRDSSCPTKVIIFDWDDTICPSSFVDRCQIENVAELSEEFQSLFSEVAKTAERCLHEASRHGEVIIITNSDDGWVKFSCERFVPRLFPFLDKYRIVSARTRYERFYPGQPLCWKAAAFAHEVNEIFESTVTSSDDGENSMASRSSLVETDVSSDSGSESSKCVAPVTKREIVSFGDSMEERTAVRIVANQLSATPKSVMFVPSPTPSEIIGQLVMLTNHMKFVCDNASSLDLEISPEQAHRCASSYLKRQKLYICESRLIDDLSRLLIHPSACEFGDSESCSSDQ